MWGRDLGKRLAERVIAEILLLHGRMFHLYRNGMYTTYIILSEGKCYKKKKIVLPGLGLLFWGTVRSTLT